MKTINNYASTNPVVSLAVKSNDPEITGSSTMEFNFEVPSMGNDIPPMKVSIRTTSTVASSVVAQEKLNEMARNNIDFIGAKLGEGINFIMENINDWAEKIHEIDRLPKKWEEQDKDGFDAV